MARILGIDPGGDSGTGWAVWDTETQKPLYLEITVHGNDTKSFIDHFNVVCWEYKPDIVVYERFVPRWGQPFNTDPIEVIGALKATGRKLERVMPAHHKPRVVKHPHGLKLLNRMFKDMRVLIGKGHSRDALSVAIFWAAYKMKDVPTLRLLQSTEEKAA